MSVVEEFLDQYAKKIDFYREAGRNCAHLCETNMEQMGIRTIVTSRAKRVDRLRDKLEKRSMSKNYVSFEEIEEDIADLAGVRIALYFPGDLVKVQKFIEANFQVKELRVFPGREVAEETINDTYQKRFSGYWATHCRVYLKEKDLSEDSRQYANTMIEIQIASALMHAWAEVEHDLVYKPYSGDLSYEEYQILDELNGLVLAGEIALQRLQKAVKNRVSQTGKEFNNHYEVAMFLHINLGSASEGIPSEIVLGRVDLMFQCIKTTEFQKPENLKELLAYVHAEDEKRPVVDQLMDRIQLLKPEIYEQYQNLKQNEELKYQMETLKIHRESGNRQGEANQLLNLGSTFRLLGDMTKAMEYCNKALKLHIRISYKQGQANALSLMGNIYADSGAFHDAANHYRDALKIYRSTNYRIGEILQLNNLGTLYLKIKDYEQAIDCFYRSLDLCKEYEYKQGERDVLYYLGNLMLSTGKSEEAIGYYEKAIAVQEEGSNQRSKICILVSLGKLYSGLGETEKANHYLQEALIISRSTDAKISEVEISEHIRFIQSLENK